MVFKESLAESSTCFSEGPLVAKLLYQINDSDASTPLLLLSPSERFHQVMLWQPGTNCVSQRSCALSVDYTHGRYTGDIGFVKELVNSWQSLVNSETM